MQSLNPTRVVARRGRDLMIMGALALMTGIVISGLGFFILLLFTSPLVGGAIIFLGGLVVIGGVITMIRGMGLRSENQPAVDLANFLGRELDNRYTLIRNVSRRGLGYIDAVLVGPPGALVFRLENKPGIYQSEGDDWLESSNGRPLMLSKLNATRECVADVHALRKYLASKQLANVPVYAMVAFTNPNITLTARQPRVPVAEINTLMKALRADFMREDRISQQQIEATVNAVYQ
jgi:hypothetical protein